MGRKTAGIVHNRRRPKGNSNCGIKYMNYTTTMLTTFKKKIKP
jgi:hypothetical protein